MLYLWLVLYFYLVKEIALEYLHRELWWVVVLLWPPYLRLIEHGVIHYYIIFITAGSKPLITADFGPQQ